MIEYRPLCKNINAAFDTGMVSITDDYRILVSKEVKESPAVYSLQSLHGQKILLPDDERLFPSWKHLAWHRDRWGLK